MEKIIKETKIRAGKLASNKYVALSVRLGYFVRGILYGLIGLLTLQVLLGISNKSHDIQDVLKSFSDAPFSSVILSVVLIGLVGYSIWGFIRASRDLLGLTGDNVSLTSRLGYIFSAVSYALLLVPTYLLLIHRYSEAGNSYTQKLVINIFQLPEGRIILAAVGLFAIIASGFQLYNAFQKNLQRFIFVKRGDMAEVKYFPFLARYGIAARAVVFGLIGISLIFAAISTNPSDAKSFGDSIVSLYSKPLGGLLILIISLGLVSFGVYSVILSWLVELPKKK